MKLIRKILKDIRDKHNLDVYITISLAIIVSGLGFSQIVQPEIIFSAILAVLAMVSLGLLINRQETEETQKALLRVFSIQEKINILTSCLGGAFAFIPPGDGFSSALPKITNVVADATDEVLLLEYQPLSRIDNDIKFQDADKVSVERLNYYQTLIGKVHNIQSGNFRYRRILQLPKSRKISEFVVDDDILCEHYHELVKIGGKKPELASLKICPTIQESSFMIVDKRYLILEWDVLDPNDRSYSGVGFLFFDDPNRTIIEGFLRIFERADANAVLVKEGDLK